MAQAQVIITAVDKTAAAVKGVTNGLKSIEKTAKFTSKFVTGIFALATGAAILRGFSTLTAAIAKTNEGQKEFAGVLEVVKNRATDLMSPKSGLNGVTASMKELAIALKDPELIKSADFFVSTLVTGFAKSLTGLVAFIKAIKDMRIFLGKTPETTEEKLTAALITQAGLKGRPLENIGNRTGVKTEVLKNEIEIANLRQILKKQELNNVNKLNKDIAKANTELSQKRISEANKIANKNLEILTNSLIVTPSGNKKIIFAYEELLKKMNDATKTSIEKDVSSFFTFQATLEDLFNMGQITKEQFNLRLTEALNNSLEEVIPTAKRVEIALTDMSEYAKSAAQSIQSAFADFLFDPFQNGLRGMLAGFANIIRRMVAEAMAARIIQSSGLGAFLNAFMGVAVPAGVPAGGGGGGRGMALGGPVSANSTYMVGERGPELFVPRSAGTIIPNNKMNGTTIAPVYNIDARGASADMQKALPAIMAENNRKIFDELDRRYGIGR